MIQKCPRADGLRHERHNVVMRRLEQVLKEKGYTTKIEHRNPTEQGLKISDLCAWKSDKYIVCVLLSQMFSTLTWSMTGRSRNTTRCSQVHVEKCPTRNPEVYVSGHRCLHMQLERSDGWKIVQVLERLRHTKIKPHKHCALCSPKLLQNMEGT